jgi:hypothetical protein
LLLAWIAPTGGFMADVDRTGSTRLQSAVRWRVAGASLLALAGLLLGGLLFQTSSIAFDYMKVRGFPLYGSASSLPRFSAAVLVIDREMEPNAARIRELLRDRATIDLDIAARTEEAQNTLSQAKTFLRPIVAVDLNFTAIDDKFQQLCAPAENVAAAAQTADLRSLPTPIVAAAVAPSAAGKMEAAKVPAAPVLTAAQRAQMEPACHIGDEPCRAAVARGIRHRMICAQQALQTVLRRKTAVTTYDFDDAKYLSDALRVTYPAFSAEDVVAATKIAEIYSTTVNGPDGGCTVARQDADKVIAGGQPAACHGWDNLRRYLWNWALSWPLAIVYLVLAFVFGVLGSLSRYLYRFAAPVDNPKNNPMEAVLGGGGAAVLVLMIAMAGFQFLTVGANSPDLAYPNPLTVSGLGVLAGLAGERVLATLQNLVGRFFSSSNGAPPPANPPAT